MPADMDIQDAAENALVAYIMGRLPGIAHGVAGWPEYEDTRDLSAGPVLSVATITATQRTVGATVAQETPGPGDHEATALLHVGEWRATVQVTLWATHKATLEALRLPLRDAIARNPLFEAGLTIPMPAYYGAPLGVEDDFTARPPQSEDEHQRGAWVMRWDLAVTGDVFQEVVTFRQDVIQVVVTADVVGQPIGEAIIEVDTPWEA